MRNRMVGAVLGLLAGACGTSAPEPVAPPPSSASVVASASAPVASSASLASLPPPVASSATAEPPPGLPANLPACARRPARAPVGFASADTKSGLIFTTTEPATAPSLQRAQRILDGFSGLASCYVSRTDGELLIVFCTSSYLNGSGNIRTGPSESFIFHRTGNDWGRIGVRAALPGAGGDPRPAFVRECPDFSRDLFADVALEDAGDGSTWLAGVEALPSELLLELGRRGEPGGTMQCPIPWRGIGSELGCGPFAHLLRPDLLDEAALARGPIAPLAIAGGRPSVSSRDPRTKGVAQAVEAGIDAAHRWPHDESEDGPSCDVTLSNADVVSVRCESSADPYRATPDRAPLRVSLAYRLADGSRITGADLFASRPDALARVTKKCLGQLTNTQRRPGAPYLPSLPTPKPDDVAFGLAQNDARFLVPHEVYLHPKTAPEGMTHRACTLSYTELGFSWRDLAKRRWAPSSAR